MFETINDFKQLYNVKGSKGTCRSDIYFIMQWKLLEKLYEGHCYIFK